MGLQVLPELEPRPPTLGIPATLNQCTACPHNKACPVAILCHLNHKMGWPVFLPVVNMGCKWLVHDVDSDSLNSIAYQVEGDTRPLANQLAERAAQLQQELQRLQVLQALQAHQQASTAQGGHGFQADSGSQAAMARQTLVQQQLQDQVAAAPVLPPNWKLSRTCVAEEAGM